MKRIQVDFWSGTDFEVNRRMFTWPQRKRKFYLGNLPCRKEWVGSNFPISVLRTLLADLKQRLIEDQSSIRKPTYLVKSFQSTHYWIKPQLLTFTRFFPFLPKCGIVRPSFADWVFEGPSQYQGFHPRYWPYSSNWDRWWSDKEASLGLIHSSSNLLSTGPYIVVDNHVSGSLKLEGKDDGGVLILDEKMKGLQ